MAALLNEMSDLDLPCNLVLMISRGWTIIVEMSPAERPAIVSMEAGERPWLFEDVMSQKATQRSTDPRKENDGDLSCRDQGSCRGGDE